MKLLAALTRLVRGPGHRRRIAALTEALDAQEWARAEELAAACLEESERLHGADAVETVPLRYALASCALAQGDFDVARERSERALALAKTDPARSDPPLPQLLEQLAAIHNHRGDDVALEGLLRDVTQSYARMRAPDPAERAAAENRLALHLARHDRRDDAREHFAEAIRLAREGDAAGLALYLHNAASFRVEGDEAADEARARFEEALTSCDDPSLRPKIAHNLATLLAGQGELEAAEARFDEALAAFEADEGPDAPSLRPTYVQRARLRHAAGRFDEAVADYERALPLAEAELGADHPIPAQLRVWIGDAHSHTFR